MAMQGWGLRGGARAEQVQEGSGAGGRHGTQYVTDVLRLDSIVFFRMVWQLEPEPEPDTEQEPMTGPCPEPRITLEPPVTTLEQLDPKVPFPPPSPQVLSQAPPGRMALPPPMAAKKYTRVTAGSLAPHGDPSPQIL